MVKEKTTAIQAKIALILVQTVARRCIIVSINWLMPYHTLSSPCAKGGRMYHKITSAIYPRFHRRRRAWASRALDRHPIFTPNLMPSTPRKQMGDIGVQSRCYQREKPCSILKMKLLMVLQERIELSTSPLPRVCSTTELLQHLVPIQRMWRLIRRYRGKVQVQFTIKCAPSLDASGQFR